MDCQFGYNCKNFVPSLGKCRVLIDRYNKRADLLADKWLNTRDVLAYTGWSPEELIERVKQGEVHAKRVRKSNNLERDGHLRFCVRCAWDWDECSMAVTGGTCVFYEPHDGAHITCIADLQHWSEEHPNMRKAPSDNDLRFVEDRLSDLRP